MDCKRFCLTCKNTGCVGYCRFVKPKLIALKSAKKKD